MPKIETEDYIVVFEDTIEIRDAVFKKVIDFYIKHQSFCGESIMQSDNPQIEAPIVLSDIADEILKFEVVCKD